MSSVSNYHRKRCITSGCKRFAVTKLPIVGGEVNVMCKQCKQCQDVEPKRELKPHPVDEMAQGECMLCCDEFSDSKKPFYLSCCNKSECCEACIVASGKHTCPFCRQAFTMSDKLHKAIDVSKQKLHRARMDEIAREDAILLINHPLLSEPQQQQVRRNPNVQPYQGTYVLPEPHLISSSSNITSFCFSSGVRNFSSFGYHRHHF